MSESQGVCFFAYNNEQIDYAKLSMYAAKKVNQHLQKPCCLITDEGTWSWLQQSHDKKEIQTYFSDVVLTEDELEPNTRTHYDSPWTEYKAQFSNSNKHKVFEYSPYDETILLDIDYIVKTDFLNQAWGNFDGVAMFNRAKSIRNTAPHINERVLFPYGIDMWWSTVIYFDKSPQSKLFFDLWEHVKENYNFYQYLYNFPGKMFRTDYCVSIAAHILNGMGDGNEVNSFYGEMQNLSGKDDIVDSNGDTWICLSHDPQKPWENLLVRHTNHDVHCINKRALGRIIDREKENKNE